MNYGAALAWLYDTQHHGIKPGLANIERLLGALAIAPGDTGGRSTHGAGAPPPRFLHVAGTNGKGSVCAMLDAILRAAGYRVGLFTSPHLIDFRERIRCDGENIPRPAVAAGLTRLRTLVAGWHPHPTFFEITTALALAHFGDHRPDYVVLETGMGGRLDATNVVRPAVSIITPIALDHQEWLGPSLAEIAAEKAGIIKPGIPVVAAPQPPAVAAVIAETAARHGAPLTFVTAPVADLPIRLAGAHQRWNAAAALAALAAAGIPLPAGAVAAGLADVWWPGRFQAVGDRLVVDGAHNPEAARTLARTWREVRGTARPTVVAGVLADKDAAGIFRALAPFATRFITTAVRSARGNDPDTLRAILRATCPSAPCTVAPNAGHAVELARVHPDPILVTGSLFLVGEVLELLARDPGLGD